MVQKPPFLGNTRFARTAPDQRRVVAGLCEVGRLRQNGVTDPVYICRCYEALKHARIGRRSRDRYFVSGLAWLRDSRDIASSRQVVSMARGRRPFSDLASDFVPDSGRGPSFMPSLGSAANALVYVRTIHPTKCPLHCVSDPLRFRPCGSRWKLATLRVSRRFDVPVIWDGQDHETLLAIRPNLDAEPNRAGPAEATNTMARIISVANQKGGVGKTTTAINIAAGLAKSGRNTLVIDVDPQCNATSGLGVEPAARHPLVAGKPLADSVVETKQPGLFVLPGSQSLADADALSASNRQRAATLRQQISGELSRFDYVFFDCPPSLGQLTRAALGTSGEIFIPIQCEYFAMEGLSQIIELARQTKAKDNHRLEIGGIVLTMFDPALELANEVADEVRQYFAETVFDSLIPRDVSISEAPSHGLSVLDYAPRARGTRAYTELVMEVIDRE